MEASKACTQCGEVKFFSKFSKDKNNKSGIKAYCKVCCANWSKKWRLENPDKTKENVKSAEKKNPKKYKLLRKSWRQTNPDCARKQRANQSKRLADTYVRRLLTAHNDFASCKDIPEEIVKAKREHLRLVRLIKELSK